MHESGLVKEALKQFKEMKRDFEINQEDFHQITADHY